MNELNLGSAAIITSNAGETLGVCGDTGRPRGRPTLEEASNRNRATEVRNNICDNIATEGMVRPGNSALNGQSDRYNRINAD